MKKRFYFILAFSIVVFPIFAIVISSTSWPREFPNAPSLTELPEISSFDQELTSEQYHTLRTGFYTAVKRNGIWYYRFVTQEYYVHIPVSAFSTPFKNNYTQLNAALTSGVASTSANCFIDHVYNSRSTSKVVLRIPTAADPSPADLATVSSTYLTHLTSYSSLSGHNVTLQCKINDQVLFEYSDLVHKSDPYTHKGNHTYVAPSTADQYARALSRTTGTISCMVTPEFTLSVDKAGSNKVILKEFTYEAVSSDSKSNIKDNLKTATELIDMVMAVGEAVASSTPAAGVAVTLYSLFKMSLSFEKTSGSYYKTSMMPLSLNRESCLKSTFTSPFKLKSDEDYWQVNINLSDSPSISGTKTKLSISFSASPG